MRTTLKRVLAGAAAMTAALGLVPSSAEAALAPGTPSHGTVTLNPTSGNAGTDFTMAISNQFCPGDSNAGFKWHTFITPVANDPATLNYVNGTPSGLGTSTTNLRTASAGGQVKNNNPAPPDGQITGIPVMDYNVFPAGTFPDGAYHVGIACTIGAGLSSDPAETERYWARTITINNTPSFSWAQGAVVAPTLNSVAPGNQQCTANFTPGASDPPATSFTATANPGGFTATGAGSPLTITGLTNNTAYTITVTETNSAGTSGPSNSLQCTPTPPAGNPVQNLANDPLVQPGEDDVVLVWDPPAANFDGANPTGYEVSSDPAVAGLPTTVPFGTDTITISDLAEGTYRFSVRAVYADRPSATPVPFVDVSILPNTVLYQAIDVTRPTGALVLTQVCNSNAEFPQGQFPTGSPAGFPQGMPLVPASNPSVVGTPAADVAGSAPTSEEDGARPTTEDGLRPQYPYPTDGDGNSIANYPTWCGLDLEEARFITRGPGAGQYFAATGVLNQVTVVDTRSDDQGEGWDITGQASTFVSETDANDTFSAQQLGWFPRVTSETASFPDGNGGTYDPNPLPGGQVQPNVATTPTPGLSVAQTLASANNGLGITVLDARLHLLIPVTADAGVYESTLTITTA